MYVLKLQTTYWRALMSDSYASGAFRCCLLFKKNARSPPSVRLPRSTLLTVKKRLKPVRDSTAKPVSKNCTFVPCFMYADLLSHLCTAVSIYPRGKRDCANHHHHARPA